MFNHPRVKICGIRSFEDAEAAVGAGAHAIAFNFVRGSRRYLNPEAAREIILRLPPFVSVVGVFADEPRYSAEEIATFCRLQVLQFHGEETPEYCRRWSYPVIKAFRLGDDAPEAKKGATAFTEWEQLAQEAHEYDVNAYLIDAYCPDALGGMGRTFDWSKIGGRLRRPLILAGGLTPNNVGEAIARVRPYGVDVASGVETGGKKDPLKAAAFVEAARFRTRDDHGYDDHDAKMAEEQSHRLRLR
ncbi:N-(5'-phosphoribosyl)anthranilate isomerase [Heliobacterium gestii]|uniref:N-(5'-phosphoribosyl)anthranilate isomerase n=1 Tax=Heliomicrobium gestii TaxID=2699 RepID=A0A845L526_HELGE|nr:phosphoribosylanthranilate isomerase [Heliomicrobium gestii]MBM7865447.1 phosphoribosylanthranilate isomerase [Heliomicrobium gestii]MZP41702.1 N-(5'-phosphoribosyl)anthranilate isomerase [Heliomicrobium gestii]